ncbi:MAG: hypothetical protein Alpg2KO_26490 [Alphaproteobacteria bacterium]
MRMATLIAPLALMLASACSAQSDIARLEMNSVGFPTTSAANLEGEVLDIPEGLRGEANLMLVAFRRMQQRNVDTWLAQMGDVQDAYPAFEYYEFPVVPEFGPMGRAFLDRAMINGIPDAEQRGRTITLFTDKAAFRKALDIESEDMIHVLLIDRKGTVLWRETGDYTKAKGAALEKRLQQLLTTE